MRSNPHHHAIGADDHKSGRADGLPLLELTGNPLDDYALDFERNPEHSSTQPNVRVLGASARGIRVDRHRCATELPGLARHMRRQSLRLIDVIENGSGRRGHVALCLLMPRESGFARTHINEFHDR